MTEERMHVELADFSYAFRVTGTDGGLGNLGLKFVPGSGASEVADAGTAAMQDVMRRYVEVLDRLFAEDFLAGGREPKMDDSYGSVDVGYSYSGSWRKPALFRRGPDVPARLSAIFGIQDPDMRGDNSPCCAHSASVTLSVSKRCKGSNRVGVSCSFDHKINVCLLRFTQSLPGVEVSDDAAEEMAMLGQQLSLEWDRPGQDFVKAIMGAKAAPGHEAGT